MCFVCCVCCMYILPKTLHVKDHTWNMSKFSNRPRSFNCDIKWVLLWNYTTLHWKSSGITRTKVKNIGFCINIKVESWYTGIKSVWQLMYLFRVKSWELFLLSLDAWCIFSLSGYSFVYHIIIFGSYFQKTITF